MPNKTKIGLDIARLRRAAGPTRREIDTEKLFECASIGMSLQQCCDYFGVSRDNFNTNQDWLDIYDEGKSDFQQTILMHQYRIATNIEHKDQTKMLQHLGKVLLKQTETQNVVAEVNTNFEDIIKALK